MKNFTFRSLILCTSLFILAGPLRSQQTLTQINGWNAYVHLPANYANTTISYPTIIFFPGIGEIGTNPAALISNGPGAYITQGWNGNVVVDGNTVEFIVISIQPPAGYPNEIAINQKIQTIKSLYRVNPNRLYLTGLSHGGWCGTTYVTGDPYGGPYTYASQIAAVVEVEGMKPDDNQPYPNLFDNFALSGGKLLGFEQINDNRDIATRVNRMNATVPNSGIFVQTNFGNGGHCCWNQFYGGQGVQPGIFSLGGVNQNLYQWMARQFLGTPPNQPPIANAGPDITITLPTNTATLSGSGTDPDGTITAYAWSKIAGPAQGTLTNANSATATAVGLVAGVYSFQLTVTDNLGATGKDTAIVTVNPVPNQPPIANAGPNILITLPINTAILVGSGTDPDGIITAYAWSKIAGPAQGTLINVNAPVATAIGLVTGVYSFQLTVTDNLGATGKDTAIITVNPDPNLPPIANAGPDITITLPTNTATLSGSGTDPDGTIAAYAWVKIAGPAQGSLTNANSATATAIGLVAGVYSFQLTVTDNLGATGKDTAIVTVNPAPNQPPIANAGPDIIITLPTNTATLSGSGTDPDGTIAAYAWVKIAGPVPGSLTNANSATATAVGLVAGVYSFQLTVTDNLGATGKDTAIVTVNPAPNQPPIANAGPDITITLPINTATLSGSGTDPDGTITAYAWVKIAGPVPGSLTNANSATATAIGLVAGVYSFQLTVTDNLGATGKDTAIVTVNPAPNQPPIANAGPDITITLPTNTATLSGSGTDPDGTIAAYAWVKIAGPVPGTLTNANSATATAIGLVAGVYSFQLTVTDNLGATGKDTAIVTVNPAPNQPPIANAGPDITITLPTNTATLSGSGTDPDGTISAYAWVKIAGPVQGSLTNANSATATAIGLVAGVYSFQLTVTDNLGATGKDTAIVTVNPAPNQPPIANAGPDITITLPINTAILVGSGTDPDGIITAYSWSKIAGPAQGTLINANTPIATAIGLVAGVYSFQLTVTDNLGATGKDTANVVVSDCNASAPVTYIIAPTSPNEIYIPDASARGWKGGDTLKIPAGTYTVIEIDSFGGDPCRDIIIINSGGLVNVNGPMRFKNNVHHVKIIGNGSAGLTYGFKTTVFTFTRVNHFTIDRIECGPNPGGVGIYGKQDPYLGQPWTQYPNYTSTKITINNCYVHDVAGEGMYIGHTYPGGDPANGYLIPQRQDSVTISNCTVTNTGWDGIQLSNARNGCLIYGNTVSNFGITDIDGQRAGIISGGNTNSQVYNNIVTNGTGNGIQFFGYGVMGCYNNTITNVGNTIHNANGEESMFGNAYVNSVETNPPQAMLIHDNQFNYPKPLGAIRFWDNNNSELVNLINNKFCFAAPPPPNWQNLYIFLQLGYININNILFCSGGPNQPPIANAGPDITITLPTNTATLSGSGTDPDGTITAYAWVKIAGPAQGSLTNANSATATAIGLVAGVYSFQLTVTDNLGATGKDTAIVTVNPAPNQPPIANAGPDITITLPTNTATLSGSGTDPDGTITAYAWVKIAGPVPGTLTNANSATATAIGLVAGVYSFQLTVTDNLGATGKDTAIVTVNSASNQPPIANAGPDITITLPTNTATLSGSGTDPDGTITAYAWVKIAGPVPGTLTNANSATATAIGLVAGVYSFQLTVTDNLGATGKDTAIVTVNSASNQPPIANAGPDITITLPTNTATLSGSGTDPDGTITAYAWVKIAGPVPGTLTNANSATATAIGLVAGVYSFQLTVTDNLGATGKDTTIVTVNSASNQPPIANAGPDITITLPTNTATLSGSGTDPDGTITAYAWVKIAGPAQGSLTNANSATATAIGLVAGVYSFQLTVTDNLGATGKDTAIVTVNSASNQPPIANAGPDITITLPTNTATLSGSGTDPDGTITAYAWVKIAGPVQGSLTNANSATATAVGLVAGVYSFQLTVTDNLGATGKDTAIVTVNPAPNQPPIANAGPNITITLPTNTATLSGNGTDPDGTITAYAWVKIAGPVPGTLTNANSATATAIGLVAGVYSFQLTVTDNLGATGKDTAIVTVNPAPNQLPTANAGSDINMTLPTNTATLTGSGTDPDGTITAYAWVKIAGPVPGTLTNANTATATASGLAEGVYVYQLTVTDNAGASAKDTIQVSIEVQRFQQDISREVKVFPNPVKDIVNVEIKSPVPNNVVSLILFSSNGIQVYQENNIVLNGYSITKTVDMSRLIPGIYFLKVSYGKEFTLATKIIKL